MVLYCSTIGEEGSFLNSGDNQTNEVLMSRRRSEGRRADVSHSSETYNVHQTNEWDLTGHKSAAGSHVDQWLEGHSGAVSLWWPVCPGSSGVLALGSGCHPHGDTVADRLLGLPLWTDSVLHFSPLLCTLSFHPLMASAFSWLSLTPGFSLLPLFWVSFRWHPIPQERRSVWQVSYPH